MQSKARRLITLFRVTILVGLAALLIASAAPPTTAQDCFDSQGNLQIIYSFTEQQGGQYPGPSGVTIDRAGNLYGTTYSGGDNSAGFAYKLAHSGGWLLDPLFSFVGTSNGGNPSGVIVGRNGSLYGGAQGGIQNCGSDGSQYCGLVFNLTPRPTACATALCSWTENVPYRFSSETDGSGTINVSASDQQGNLYGTTSSGGADDAGTVFELTPSAGGWTKTTLYSFTGGSDGGTPTQVLVGNDGGLYGAATSGGMYRSGVVFQLMPSGGGWTESVLHAFGNGDGFSPTYLNQDSAGNLYGSDGANGLAQIFTLQKTGSGWTFSEFVVGEREEENLHNLTVDAAGNVYGTGTYRFGTAAVSYGTKAGSRGTMFPSGHRRSLLPSPTPYNYIFKAAYSGGNWQFQTLVFLQNEFFPAVGSLAVDASGNLYGTTWYCGTNGYGTVWQVSP